MNSLEESFHIDIALRMAEGDNVLTNKIISDIRDLTIGILKPIVKLVPRNLSDEIIVAYKAEGISLEWDLKSTDAYDFCFMARRQVNPLIQNKTHAIDLLEVCTRALDEERVVAAELTRKQVTSAYALLDSNLLDSGKRFSKGNSIRARKRRGKVTEHGKTLNEVIKDLAKNPEHKDLTAKELWTKLLGELNCLDVDFYESKDSLEIVYYLIGSDKQKIKSFKSFQNDLSKFKSQ